MSINSAPYAASGYVIEPPAQASLSVSGSDNRFPVHRVYCVGRNYAAHAVEMGHDPDKEPPFFFQKNPDNLIADATEFPYPKASSDVHHEIELLVALKSGGENIDVSNALDCVFGYGVSLDMTRRDLQGEMKKMGRPWEIGKAFEDSAPAGPVYSVSEVGHPDTGDIWLKVNGEIRQTGDLNQMIWKTAEMISMYSTPSRDRHLIQLPVRSRCQHDRACRREHPADTVHHRQLGVWHLCG